MGREKHHGAFQLTPILYLNVKANQNSKPPPPTISTPNRMLSPFLVGKVEWYWKDTFFFFKVFSYKGKRGRCFLFLERVFLKT